MARITLSGAPSRRSERLTRIPPSRKRMVVFSEVNRRKRTAMGGIGARGRKTRYSSWKMAAKSALTKMEGSTAPPPNFRAPQSLTPENSELRTDLLRLGLRPILAPLILVQVEVFGLLLQHLRRLIGQILLAVNGLFAR